MLTIRYVPSSRTVVVLASWVPWFVAVTIAPVITAPLGSLSVPVNDPNVDCAIPGDKTAVHRTNTSAIRLIVSAENTNPPFKDRTKDRTGFGDGRCRKTIRANCRFLSSAQR